jgi:O-antigen/teichoic acid export membrane protein
VDDSAVNTCPLPVPENGSSRRPLISRVKALLRSQSLRWNFLGNVTGRAWLGGMNLVAIPIFVHLLGTESFGIVGLVQTLQSLLVIFDLGLAPTVNREVAMLRARGQQCQVADVAKTFEWIYWVVAMVILLVVAGGADWIGRYWLRASSIGPADLRMAIVLGGMAIAVRWPVALYTGILQGLERQVLQNAILIVAATTRIGMTMAAVVFVSRTVYAFLVAQALANALEVLLIGYAARRLAKTAGNGEFRWAVIRRVWRFAIGLMIAASVGTLAASTDKLLISRILPLSNLTYYSVCATATGALQVIYLAAAVSFFPRMSACWKRQERTELLRLYLVNLRMTVYLCLGPVLVLCFFSLEVLRLWTRSLEVATHASAVLPWLAAATLVNCAVAPAYNLLIAAGQTRVPLVVNGVSLALLWIGGPFMVEAHGLIGAAACYLALNLLSFLVYGEYCRRKIFQMDFVAYWWGFPVGLFLPAGTVGLLSKAFLPDPSTAVLTVLWFALSIGVFYAAGLLFISGDERRRITIAFLPR